jgi:hypothetical protein
MNRTLGKPTRKTTKSYSLSPESVEFLEALRQKRSAASVSSILDEILQAARHQHQRATLERAVVSYYGSLSDEEATEQLEWNRFAEREFPNSPSDDPAFC